MAEYIDKQAFNDAVRDAVRKYPSTFYNGLETARQIAHDLPPADVQPVRHGRWMWQDAAVFGNPYGSYKCECGCVMPHKTDYCPNCGAKMDGGET